MKIEKLNENKLKVMFDYTELEENNISIHSFLANSKQTQEFFLAILNIANEDFGFKLNTSQITYDTFSFSNKYFVIIITTYNSSQNNFSNKQNIIFYKISDTNELFMFCNILKKVLPTLNFNMSLYQYQNNYFLKFDFSNLEEYIINKILLIISEFKDSITFSNLALSHFEEFSDIIIENFSIL